MAYDIYVDSWYFFYYLHITKVENENTFRQSYFVDSKSKLLTL